MSRTAKGLTDKTIRQAKTTGKEYTLSDGEGLQLRIRDNGSKTWQFRYRNPETNKAAKISLGTYPHLSLKQARKQAMVFNEQIALGHDPKTLREVAMQEYVDLHENILINVAAQWLEMKRAEVTKDHADDIWRSLELHIFPKMADIPLKKN